MEGTGDGEVRGGRGKDFIYSFSGALVAKVGRAKERRGEKLVSANRVGAAEVDRPPRWVAR